MFHIPWVYLKIISEIGVDGYFQMVYIELQHHLLYCNCCWVKKWMSCGNEFFKLIKRRLIKSFWNHGGTDGKKKQFSLKQEDESSTEAKVAAGHVAANTIRLLIAGTQAGCLIGISGQNIEKLRDSCGAIITILAQNQLPLCASAHESDRVVQVSFSMLSMLKLILECCLIGSW